MQAHLNPNKMRKSLRCSWCPVKSLGVKRLQPCAWTSSMGLLWLFPVLVPWVRWSVVSPDRTEIGGLPRYPRHSSLSQLSGNPRPPNAA